ncbi:MAG: tetratricopeptide repeat protein [Planctomycetes bacterium]|jgi:tetratricopeptide (TPR) repeat protein|nr:tetratricopeptide repeat protein [Planctomycetota bacterium]
MIPDEFTLPQVAGWPEIEMARRLRHRLFRECRRWGPRLGVLILLTVLGGVGKKLIDASGIRAAVLADIANVCSSEADTSSLLKGHDSASAKAWSSLAVCQRLVQLKPQDAQAHVMLGNAYMAVGRSPEAVERYHDALTLDPNCFEAHLGMGKVHFARGGYSDAVGWYQRALKIRPRSADAHLSLGLALSNAGQYEEAMQAFQKAKELDPAAVQDQVHAGNSYLQAGMCAQAIEYLRGAVHADQKHAQAYFNLGRAYLRVGDKALALEQQRILQGLDRRLAEQLRHMIGE